MNTKQTEIGEIPKDWEVVKLGEVGIFQAGNGFPVKYQGNRNGKYPFFKVSDMNNVGNETALTFANHYVDEVVKTVLSLKTIPTNAIAFAKIGAAIFLERKKIITQDSFIDNNMMAFIPNQDFLNSKFAYFQFLAQSFGELIEATALPSLGSKVLRQVLISLPSHPEQTAIAAILSDTDRLLAALRALIGKKRAIKTAAMQQLLSGRLRLPGFASNDRMKNSELGEIPEDWEMVKLGKVLKIRHGKNQKEVASEQGEYPILATGGQIGWATDFLYDKPSVLIGRKGTIDKPKYQDAPFWTVDTLFFSEIFENCDPKFIFYKFCMVDWLKNNEASGVPSQTAKRIESLKIALPQSKPEQTAIALTLSDMDSEIAALEARAAKLAQIKQGLMQNLLTGKIRVNTGAA
ncbi:MAG: restriction endonuclease subunit S [Cardiobacterium sp.]|jgi:restriction modification system DNA specificity domain protein